MNQDQSNPILAESIARVKETMGQTIEDLFVERAVLGLFFSGVKLSDGSGGVCFTPIKEIPEAVCCPSSAKAMPLSGRLRGRPVQEYLSDIFSGNILKKALGIAVLNALSASCWSSGQHRGYLLETGVDAFDKITIDPHKKTVVIGALAPMLKKLRTAEADFHVLEMDPSTLKPYEMPYYIPAGQAARYVPEADLLIITGTTLINDTLPGLLSMTKDNAEILVTGPTASMLPEAFFSRGVTHIGGVLVTKPDELLDIISEGGSGYHFFGKSAERLVIRKQAVTSG